MDRINHLDPLVPAPLLQSLQHLIASLAVFSLQLHLATLRGEHLLPGIDAILLFVKCQENRTKNHQYIYINPNQKKIINIFNQSRVTYYLAKQIFGNLP